MQSELDLLKQENVRLVARITELEQIAKEKNKLEVRIMELEQTTKSITNDLKSPEYSTPLPNSNGENVQIKDSSTRHEANHQSMTSTDLVTSDTSEQVVNTISDTSYFNETCFRKSKSLGDKEIDVFLDSENKKRVSNEIRQRNKEKKLLHSNEVSISQDQDLSLVDQDTSTESEKTITSSSLYDQIVEGLIQEITCNQEQSIVSSEINPSSNNGKIDFTEISKSCIQDMDPGSLQSLSDLFDKAIKSGQKQILCWYYYSLEFENKVKSLTRDGVGVDKIKYITYSASTISGLKDTQIQHIINQVTSKTVTKCHGHTNSEVSESIPSSYISNSSGPNNLPKAEVSALFTSQTETKTLPEKQNNPTHDHAYFCNKILLRYSDLYKTFITEKFDYYDIIEGSLCPVCKLNHEDGKSVKGRYEAGSYFIIYGKHEIESVSPAYMEETELNPWIKSKTSEFSQIEKDAEKKTLFVSRVNVQSIPSK
ncbi:hypothetical protein Glove_8g5 [Diversispora epigaea]|uniref:Uncharacterized protein n=1 Tax=Diversispora epigaea TaxID=1348612 RepID=A0A397JQ61_9GLOM|nr:hypothetical protein Glove_8g5 [Diversispora epigaea]